VRTGDTARSLTPPLSTDAPLGERCALRVCSGVSTGLARWRWEDEAEAAEAAEEGGGVAGLAAVVVRVVPATR